jgi:hypothetical protein
MTPIYYKNNRGSVTLIVVFITTIILFLLVFSDHVMAMKEDVSSQNDAATEQAFYSSQSCLEEGFMRLRTDANFPGGQIHIGELDCTMTAHPAGSVDSGSLTVMGTFQGKIRTANSFYTGAGPSQVRSQTALFHILDRSGSMADDGYGCTIPSWTTPADCAANQGVWGLQPSTSVRESAKLFIDKLDSGYDKIGVVSYNEQVTLDSIATNNFVQVKSIITNLPSPSGYTNIGDALQKATDNLMGEPSGTSRFEILLTDGEANRPNPVPPPAHDAKEYAINKANDAKSQHIIIFAIGLGNHYDENFLKTVASTVDGTVMYFRAPTPQDLNSIYNRIANIIITYNIDLANWQEQ